MKPHQARITKEYLIKVSNDAQASSVLNGLVSQLSLENQEHLKNFMQI